MSFLSKIFGESNKDTVQTTSEAIQKLRETEEMLMKKQDFLEKKIDNEIETARKNASKNKAIAIQALKRKKRYEKQLQQIDGALSTIEMQREALESATTNTAVLTTMKSASDALKQAHKRITVDQVHDMMDDIAEQQDVALEISHEICTPIAFGQDIDENELEKELEELEQEEMDKIFIGVDPSTNDLPAPPVIDSAPPKSTGKEAEEKKNSDMKELIEWAS